MDFITGGAFQGKGEFAKRLYQQKKEAVQGENDRTSFVEAGVSSIEELLHSDLILHFHRWIQCRLSDGVEETQIYAWVHQLIQENPHMILCMDEMGCGIVPTDVFDRQYRELVGRVSCLFAKEAERVYRVNCGIEMQIK